MAKFIIGIRNDLKEIFKEFGDEKELYGVFGPAPRELVTSGRIDCLPPKSLVSLKEQISLAHEHGLKFNVLANSLCQHGKEFDKEFKKRMTKLFDFVTDAEADAITITNSNIMRLAKTYREQYKAQHGKVPFDITASAWRDIITTYQAEENVKEFGMEIIQTHQYINRDFKTLRELHELKKKLNFDIVLYASTGSTWCCDDRLGHRCAISHPENTLGKKDSYKEHCIEERKRNPFLVYIAPTIPPEVIGLYENLGYDKFKLAGRDMSTEWRIKNLRRYLNRKTESGIGIADLCDTNLGRKMPYIPIEEVVKLIKELEKVSHRQDFNFVLDYVNFCKERYASVK